MICIETYLDDYKQDIIDLILHIENDENKLDLTLEEQPDLSDIPTAFRNGGGEFWIALDNETLIGTIGLMKKNDKVAVLKKFFVRSDMRGTGISKKLYEAFLNYARENGICQIILDTPSVAERAHNFYERAGFRRITHEELPVHYEFPDRDCYLYLLNIE